MIKFEKMFNIKRLNIKIITFRFNLTNLSH
jgi:hypothetical protein